MSDEELAGPAIPDELTFTTATKEQPPEKADDDRRIPFKVDGEVYYARRPRKLAEVMTMVSRAAARRASLPDQMWAVLDFLDKVIEPESARLLMDRYDDDDDPFGVEDLLQIMERLVTRLAQDGTTGRPAPARARRRAVASR